MGAKQGELDSVGGSELVEDVREVTFDRVFTDREPLSDLFVRVAGHDRPDDLELAPRQSERLAAPACRFELTQARGDLGDAFAANPVMT